MRGHLVRTVTAAAGAAVALATCGFQAAAEGSGPLGPVAGAGGPGCVTIDSAGPRALLGAGFRALSTGSGTRAGAAVGSLGQAGWRRLALPGQRWARPAAAATGSPAPRPAGPRYTVTVAGTDISGKPAGGRFDAAFLFNADNSAVFDGLGSVKGFTAGAARFRVPAGHYWAVGDFVKLLPKQKSWHEYLDVLPQFTVSRNSTVHLAAAAATSAVEAVVSRTAVRQYSTFQLIRAAAAGPAVSLGWLVANGGPAVPEPTLFVSPTAARPTVGTLATVTSEQLGSAAFVTGSRYLYDVAYQSSGTIPPQRQVVDQAALATVHLRYYSSVRSVGLSGTFPGFPVNQVCSLGAAIFGVMPFPATTTDYLLAGWPLSWQTQYIQNQAQDFSGGQIGPAQAYLPGQRRTQNFGAYPLHPAPNVRLSDIPGQPPVPVSAGRAGNTLRLAMTAFSDSTPGHAGQGTFPPVPAAASYQIDQNGTPVAGGPVARFTGPFTATATLRPAPSAIRFTLDTAQSATLDPLSVASHTVWTWHSARVPRATLPPGWTCHPGPVADRACAGQPLLTLRYGVVGLGLDGRTAPGQQVLRIGVRHLQPGPATAITRTTVSVSFDGGRTWRPARVTGTGGSYAAVFPAPASTQVTLRTSATDAAGGSITETITNAYQTSP